MHKLLILTAMLLSGLPGPASSQSACDGRTTIDAINCAHDNWAVADAELNRLWKKLKPRADAAGTGRALLAQQRQWLKLRDGRCEKELGHGGSLDQAIYYDCMKDLTLQRNAQFRAMLR